MALLAKSLPKRLNRAILTGRQMPGARDACIGMCINENGHLEAGCIGHLVASVNFPLMVWVEPRLGEDKDFEACTKKDLDEALYGTRGDEPAVGEVAFGWWRCGNTLTNGYGIVRKVCRNLAYPMVDPVPEKEDCHLSNLSAELLQELTAEGAEDSTVPEDRLRLLREAVADRDLSSEVRRIERTICNRGVL